MTPKHEEHESEHPIQSDDKTNTLDSEENRARVLEKMETDKLLENVLDNFSSSIAEKLISNHEEEEKHEEEKHEEEKHEEEKHEEKKHEEEKQEEVKHEEEDEDGDLHAAHHTEVFKSHSENQIEVSDKESEKGDDDDDNILKQVVQSQEEIMKNMADNLRLQEREEYLRRQREGEDLLHRSQNDDSDQLRDMSDARKMESDFAKEESDARKLESDSNFFDTDGLIGSQLFD